MAVLIQLCMLVIFLVINNSIAFAFPAQKMTFWNSQQKGANIFNRSVTAGEIKAAKKLGVKFIRLAPDKFISSHRDFLIGNADGYRSLVNEDVVKLKRILAVCQQEKMPVVMTMLSLPGSRWKQNNQNKDDLRIWKDEKYQAQAALFWQDLAAALKGHPAIVGYNLLNEPHPERIFPSQDVHPNPSHQAQIQKILYDLYSRIIKHIRQVDKDTPIILDSSAYADAKTFRLLMPQEDKNVLYSFHMYEPYEYTNHKMNKGKFRYPGPINGKQWNRKALEEYMAAVVAFQKKHAIESNKIVVGEFGGYRMSAGLEKYFEDLIAIFTKEGWHFAFYAFREDTWDGMDYELGTKHLPWDYWQAIAHGVKPRLKRRATYPAFLILKRALNEKPFAKRASPLLDEPSP